MSEPVQTELKPTIIPEETARIEQKISQNVAALERSPVPANVVPTHQDGQSAVSLDLGSVIPGSEVKLKDPGLNQEDNKNQSDMSNAVESARHILGDPGVKVRVAESGEWFQKKQQMVQQANPGAQVVTEKPK